MCVYGHIFQLHPHDDMYIIVYIYICACISCMSLWGSLFYQQEARVMIVCQVLLLLAESSLPQSFLSMGWHHSSWRDHNRCPTISSYCLCKPYMGDGDPSRKRMRQVVKCRGKPQESHEKISETTDSWPSRRKCQIHQHPIFSPPSFPKVLGNKNRICQV